MQSNQPLKVPGPARLSVQKFLGPAAAVLRAAHSGSSPAQQDLRAASFTRGGRHRGRESPIDTSCDGEWQLGGAQWLVRQHKQAGSGPASRRQQGVKRNQQNQQEGTEAYGPPCGAVARSSEREAGAAMPAPASGPPTNKGRAVSPRVAPRVVEAGKGGGGRSLRG